MNDRVFNLRNVPVYNGYTDDTLEVGIYFTYNNETDRLTVNGKFDVNDIIMNNRETGTVTRQFPKREFFYITLQMQIANAHEQPIVHWLEATSERYAAFIIESTAPRFIITLSYSMVPSFALRMARKSVR